jgi:hypothetical protein
MKAAGATDLYSKAEISVGVMPAEGKSFALRELFLLFLGT